MNTQNVNSGVHCVLHFESSIYILSSTRTLDNTILVLQKRKLRFQWEANKLYYNHRIWSQVHIFLLLLLCCFPIIHWHLHMGIASHSGWRNKSMRIKSIGIQERFYSLVFCTWRELYLSRIHFSYIQQNQNNTDLNKIGV